MFEEESEAHWKFLERWLHMIYVDAMMHGYKHGYQDASDESEIEKS